MGPYHFIIFSSVYSAAVKLFHIILQAILSPKGYLSLNLPPRGLWFFYIVLTLSKAIFISLEAIPEPQEEALVF